MTTRLPGFTPEERLAFAEFALSGLFDAIPGAPSRCRFEAAYPLYAHQAELLLRGVSPGRPGIVTSGTGSGKTEAFLLPVFAMLAKEAVHWQAPRGGYLGKRWWQRGWDEAEKEFVPYTSWGEIPSHRRPTKKEPSRTPFRPQRLGEKRPAAVRALVLYPMNALVADGCDDGLQSSPDRVGRIA